MSCVRCRQRDPSIGVLCLACSKDLTRGRLAPEQVKGEVGDPTAAALIDRWGRAHALATSTIVGRDLDGHGLSVIEGLVSRHHARVSWTADQWTIRDLGSSNGTFVNDVRVDAPRALRDRDDVFIGQVGFVFVEDVSALPLVGARVAIGETFRPDDQLSASLPGGDIRRTAAVQLIEPTGGGGGLLVVDGKQVQLSPTQFELIDILSRRMRDERHQPVPVRGFVRTSELIADLSWDTRHPDDNHVKQLVRRVRRAFDKAGVGDLIESRHRFGYRLRIAAPGE